MPTWAATVHANLPVKAYPAELMGGAKQDVGGLFKWRRTGDALTFDPLLSNIPISCAAGRKLRSIIKPYM